ncbi:MAG TPA: hemerythrin domain-containing protein [Frankiaceae bacterium]|nr:hemerythrin domain-containing protein [Frankiaceae bacterium]
MSATDPLRDEHRALLPLIEDIRIAAEAADVISRSTLVAEIDAVLRFLTGHLVPHARAEEAALYPAVERVLGAPGATATMTRDHVEVGRLVEELTAERDALAGGAGPDRVRAVQRLLYGLYAVLRLHFAKEEEVYLPLLDAALTPAEASAMFAEMNVAAHAAAH